jgi:hypothetical protein
MIDPLEKAKQCECTIEACNDPQRKIALTNLQKLWVAIAYERTLVLRGLNRNQEEQWNCRLYAAF